MWVWRLLFQVGCHAAPRVAWSHPDPFADLAEVKDHLACSRAAMDGWVVGGERDRRIARRGRTCVWPLQVDPSLQTGVLPIVSKSRVRPPAGGKSTGTALEPESAHRFLRGFFY